MSKEIHLFNYNDNPSKIKENESIRIIHFPKPITSQVNNSTNTCSYQLHKSSSMIYSSNTHNTLCSNNYPIYYKKIMINKDRRKDSNRSVNDKMKNIDYIKDSSLNKGQKINESNEVNNKSITIINFNNINSANKLNNIIDLKFNKFDLGIGNLNQNIYNSNTVDTNTFNTNVNNKINMDENTSTIDSKNSYKKENSNMRYYLQSSRSSKDLKYDIDTYLIKFNRNRNKNNLVNESINFNLNSTNLDVNNKEKKLFYNIYKKKIIPHKNNFPFPPFSYYKTEKNNFNQNKSSINIYEALTNKKDKEKEKDKKKKIKRCNSQYDDLNENELDYYEKKLNIIHKNGSKKSKKNESNSAMVGLNSIFLFERRKNKDEKNKLGNNNTNKDNQKDFSLSKRNINFLPITLVNKKDETLDENNSNTYRNLQDTHEKKSSKMVNKYNILFNFSKGKR